MGTNKDRPGHSVERTKDISPPGWEALDEQTRRHHALPFPWDNRSLLEPRSLSRALTETHRDPQVLWQSQKLESLGLMAGGVAHDFNNFLLAIMGNADLLDKALGPESIHRPLLTEITTAAGRAGDLCNQLLAFAGKGQFRVRPIDLSDTVHAMVRMLKVAISGKISLRLELGDDGTVIAADTSQIHQVVMNLVVNASESIGDHSGIITLRTGVRSSSDCHFEQCVITPHSSAGTFIFLEVTDTGPGMDPLTRSRAFDPFYSTKPQGRGLGLASVLGIVRSHEGGLGLDTTPGRGTTMTVLIPRRKAVVPVAPRPPKLPVPGGSGTILVVDDEEYLRVLSARMLSHLGYEVHLAADGVEALNMCHSLGPKLDCVMLDLVMPEMDGREVYAEIRKISPDIKVLLTSGYHEAEISRRFANSGLSGFLQKPYVLEDLAHKLALIIHPQAEEEPPSAD